MDTPLLSSSCASSRLVKDDRQRTEGQTQYIELAFVNDEYIMKTV
jgi:hypothetical protein